MTLNTHDNALPKQGYQMLKTETGDNVKYGVEK